MRTYLILAYLLGLTTMSIGVAQLPDSSFGEGLIWWGCGIIVFTVGHYIPKEAIAL